ncbi:hypothetical protein [Pseudomonas putida]|uniref:hypothetical protein n=1 Tax=Pseudomonas putida TaxID=303 RepID=UPI0009A1D078|nr:hypothetical protein [Pseudomonas putida]
MKKQSLADFLKEMAKKPQTLDWDVVAAFDRDKTNYLLLQDYISRFGKDSLFDPVDGSESTGGTTHTMDGLQLDKPRLSFDNAVITESRARCVMRTVGGKIYETTTPQGTTRKEIKRFGISDGLVGPILTMTINLRNTPGTVTSAGAVELDLAGNGAANFEFTGVDTAYESVKLGTYLKSTIEKWGDDKKKFQLGELRKNPEDPLQPGEFRVLTRPAPGATARHADNFGDGEVLLMIGLDDREGKLPPSDTSIPYLLPDGYSSNLVISFEQILKRMMYETLIKRPELSGAKFDEVSVGNFKRYVAVGGGYSTHLVLRTWDGWSLGFPLTELPFKSATPFTLELGSGAMIVKWAGSNEIVGKASTWVVNPPYPPTEIKYEGKIRVDWDIKYTFKAKLGKDASGRAIIVIEGVVDTFDFRTAFVSGSGDGTAKKCFMDGYGQAGPELAARFERLRDLSETLGFSLDAFRFNGLLFPDESVVVPRTIELPGDLTALGDLARALTGNRLSHNEVTVTAASNHTFTVTPALEGVEWSVSPLPGDPTGDENTGTIGKSTGVYTAPAADSFGYAFRRVIVTAKKGDWSANALVHLVAAPVSVFPLVNTVNLTTKDDEGNDLGGYVVWAGSTNGGALDWKISGNAGGSLKVVDDPNVQDARQYWAATDFPTDGEGLEKVLRVDKVEVSQGSGPVTTCEMLLTKTPKSEYFFDFKAVGGGTQFEFWVTDDDGEKVQLPDTEIEWHLVSGKGTLDEKGVYKFADNAADHYIIVAAIDLEGGSRNLQWNYRILTRAMLDASQVATQRSGVK